MRTASAQRGVAADGRSVESSLRMPESDQGMKKAGPERAGRRQRRAVLSVSVQSGCDTREIPGRRVPGGLTVAERPGMKKADPEDRL